MAIAHGQPLVRAGLRVLLEREPGIAVVGEARRIIAGPGVAVMVLTACETDARVFASLRAGAAGLLLEDREPAALVRAVRLLSCGGRPRARRCRRTQPAREAPMLTPKVIEIMRGSAHIHKGGEPKAGSSPRS